MIKFYNDGEKKLIFRAIAETNTHWVDKGMNEYKKTFTSNPQKRHIREFLNTEQEFETEILSIKYDYRNV